MSDLRKAAKEFIEAWDWDWSGPRNEALEERIEALRQALAQPEWVEITKGECDEYAYAIEAKLKEKNT